MDFAGQHFFPCSVLPGNQDIGIRCAASFHLYVQLLHGCRRAPVHSCAVSCMGGFRVPFVPWGAGLFQRLQQPGVVVGLHHEVRRPALQSFHRQTDVGEGREEHHGEVWVACLDFLQVEEAFAAAVQAGGEVHVEQDDIHRLALQQGENALGRRETDDVGEAVTQQVLQGGQNAFVVIDD